ncbi:MAG TPA: hypothetical protein PK735_15650, partial [Flavobacteriales bacterium]|nr:hypothetical protein [Flavobacteriales bacterium]
MNSGLQAALANYLERGLTFACFRRPGKPIELWVQRTPELDSVDRSLLYELNEVFLLAPFELDPTRIQFIRADKDLVIVDPQADCDLFPEFEGTRTTVTELGTDVDQRNFEYAVSNALDDLTVADVGQKASKRDRVLTLEELRTLWDWAEKLGPYCYYGNLAKILLSFGARTQEVRLS